VKNSKWQCAWDTPARRRDTGITVERAPIPAHWDWPLRAPLELKVPARAFDWQSTDAHALPDGPVAGSRRETIRLAPYGCSKFSISMFPVTPRAWSRGFSPIVKSEAAQ